MKRYFLYQLKKNVSTFLVMALVFLVLVIICMTESGTTYASQSLRYLYIGLMVVAAALPAWMMRYRMNKRSCDLNYSMPIKRSKMLATRFLIGFMAMMAAFTIAFAVMAIRGATLTYTSATRVHEAGDRVLRSVYYLPLYFATFVPAFVVYSISSFAFTRANSEVDGIIFILFAMAVTGLLAYMLQDLIYSYEAESVILSRADGDEERLYKIYRLSAEYYFPMSSLYVLSDKFELLLTENTDNLTQDIGNILTGGILMCALSAGATAGMLLTERNSRAENVSQPSESPFGYKVMTPLVACLGTIMVVEGVGADATLAIYVVLIAAVGYALEWAYRRSPRIGWKRTLVLILAIGVGVGLGFLLDTFFGKSYIVL